jgi:hypothetical protein
MRRHPPFTVVAYIAYLLALFVVGFIYSGAAAWVAVWAVVAAPFLAGLWFQVRPVWILVVVFRVVSLWWVLVARVWWPAAIVVVELALLLAPPTRRYFRRDPNRARKQRPMRSPRARAIRLSAVGLAWLAICLVGYFVFLVRDPLSGDLDLVRSDRPGVRVLFVGNSLTYYNGMTGMVRDLAKGDRGAPAIFAVQYARPGATLDDALDDHRLRELIADERWQSVVLQENSQITSRPSDVKARMLPAAAGLQGITRARRAQTVLFETWGYEHGLPGYDDSYGWMQRRVTWGYRTVAGTLPAVLAPVGEAWHDAVRRRPGIDLWKGDGRHPSRSGSYLAACVFYAILTRRDSADSMFTAGLDPAEARWLARIADSRVHHVYPVAAR